MLDCVVLVESGCFFIVKGVVSALTRLMFAWLTCRMLQTRPRMTVNTVNTV